MSGPLAQVHPDDRSRAAAAVAEAVDDLERLLGYARRLYASGSDHLDVSAALTEDLLGQPAWTRLELASVLAVAIADRERPAP